MILCRIFPKTQIVLKYFQRKIDRLPWPYGECTHEFEQSPLVSHLRKTGQRELLKHRIYTYEVRVLLFLGYYKNPV